MSKPKNCFWSPTGDYLCYNAQAWKQAEVATTTQAQMQKPHPTIGTTTCKKGVRAGSPFLVNSSDDPSFHKFGNASPVAGYCNSPNAYWQNNQNFDLIRPLGTYPRYPENQNPYLYFPNTFGIRDPRDNCFVQSNY